MNVSMNPNYIEDLSSDYVCMTRAPQAATKPSSMNPVSAVSCASTTKLINQSTVCNSSTALKLTSNNLKTLQQEHLNANNISQYTVPSVNDFDKASSVSSDSSNNSKFTALIASIFCSRYSINCKIYRKATTTETSLAI